MTKTRRKPDENDTKPDENKIKTVSFGTQTGNLLLYIIILVGTEVRPKKMQRNMQQKMKHKM